MKDYFKSPPFYITVGILLFVGIIYWFTRDKFYIEYTNAAQIKIANKWELPRVLEEVSGIDYIDKERIACIQDEVGELFIYNLVSKQIEKRIKFAENDDFEGVAMVGNKAYIMRSDGKIFSIDDIRVENPVIEKYDTQMSFKYDFEGLCYDKKKDRLLLAAKSNGPDDDDKFKPVFEFKLGSKQLTDVPIYQLFYDDPIFEGLESAGTPKIFRTSEIHIHPKTGDIYMLDGVIGKLLILSSNWQPKSLYIFNPSDFPQPKGITFDPDGKTFISNEGEWKPANILEVVISEKSNDSTQTAKDSLR